MSSDNTIRFGGRSLQLGPVGGRRSLARARVEVHERLNGSLVVLWRGELVAAVEAPPDAARLRVRSGSRLLVDLPEPDVVELPVADQAPPIQAPVRDSKPIHPWRRWTRR